MKQREMSATEIVLDYTFESKLGAKGLQCAASTRPALGNSFFHAKLWQPRLVGQLLTCLQRLVQSQFYTQKPPLRDPIVTSHKGCLRWEGFSGCCGVYGRVDLDERAFAELEQSLGTTNVDFNANMVSHLARLGTMSDAQLSVTREGVELQSESGRTIEKKVALPERWIRGLGEVQVYQARLQPLWSLSSTTLSQFFQSQKLSSSSVQHFELRGALLKPALKASSASIPLSGIERLKIVQPLLPLADRVHVWVDSDESGVSAWQVETKVGSFWIVLSPKIQRGFSGEGQVVELLAASDWKEHLDKVLSWLGHRSTLDPAEAASQLGVSMADITSVFAALAVSGLAGFDASSGYYFQRKLPFLANHIEQFQPRYSNAQRLLEENRVKILSQSNSPAGRIVDCQVVGDHCEYHVRIGPERDTCTCYWYNRYQGSRGSCKHILAAKLFLRSIQGTIPTAS